MPVRLWRNTPLLFSLALLCFGLLMPCGARANPSMTDAAWRQRVLLENLEDAYRLPRPAAVAALQALQASGTQALSGRARVQQIVRFLMLNIDLDERRDCGFLLDALAQSQGADRESRSDWLDLLTIKWVNPRLADCGPSASPETVLALAQSLGDPARLAAVKYAQAYTQLDQGRFSDGTRLLHEALNDAGTEFQKAVIEWTLAQIAMAESPSADSHEKALALFSKAAARVDLAKYPRFELALRGNLGMLHGVMGQRAEELSEFMRVAERLDGSLLNAVDNLRILNGLVAALCDAGRPQEALKYLARLKPLDPEDHAGRRNLARAYLKVYALIHTEEALESGRAWVQRGREAMARDSTASPHNQKYHYLTEVKFFEAHRVFREAFESLQLANAAGAIQEQRSSEKLRLQLQEQLHVAAKDKENARLQADVEMQAVRQRSWIIAFGVAMLSVLVACLALVLAMRRGKRLAQLSEELARRNAELQANSNKLTRLLTAACHDLRQPAHALNMYAALGAEVRADPVRFESWLGRVQRCGQILSEMLSELMDLGQLSGGVYKPRLSDIPLQELFNDLALHFGPLAQKKGLRLEVEPHAAVVVSDRHLLRRILFNLVSNAVKYTERGQVSVQASLQEGQLWVRVADTGPGIPAESQSEVFRDYVRLNPGHAAEGIGIGLAVVRRSADLLGHALRLESQSGKGTCVALQLQLSTQPQTSLLAAAEIEAAKASPEGALVALLEDDAEVREATQNLLQRWGYRVVAAANGDELLQMLQAQALRPELLVTDYHLKGRDGLSELKRLRASMEEPALPALLVTGDLEASIVASAEQHAAYVVSKPIHPSRMAAVVRDLIRTWRQRPARQTPLASRALESGVHS